MYLKASGNYQKCHEESSNNRKAGNITVESMKIVY